MHNRSLSRRGFVVLSTGLGVTAAAATVQAQQASALPTRPLSEDAWTFGLQADTQWREDRDGENPGTTAFGIQQMVNEQFIAKGVDFVVQVGDNVDVEHDTKNGNPEVRTLPIKAQAVQPLYDAGIGFYTLRGNHESSQLAAQEFPVVFPQNLGQGPNPLAGATNFSSPSDLLAGLSYSFDVKNLRIIMLDQFRRPDGSGSTNSNIIDQLDWIEERVMGRPEGMHCLVFAHKNLIGQNHVDTLFGSNPGENPEAYDRFIRIMDEGQVPYVIGGHDHVHHRSRITSPDGSSQVEQLIAGSNSHKFYVPKTPSNDQRYGGPSEVVLAQELWTITHYVVTVDGPRLYIDFYSISTGQDYDNSSLAVTPPASDWYWREQWGYSLNGEAFLVDQGDDYTVVQDEFEGTTASIIAGVNTSSKVDYAGRPMSKEISTGWQSAGEGDNTARLYLWGTATNLQLNDPDLEGTWPNADETDESDPFVLRLSGGPAKNFNASGSYGLATLDENGNWVNAVETNYGGTPRFVRGAYKPGYELGTYGVDPRTKDVWAVINHGGVFVARSGL